MSLSCRVLSRADEEQIRQLWLTKKSIFKLSLPEDYVQRLIFRIDRIFSDEKPQFYLYGVFDGEELIGTWAVMEWLKLPYYSLGDLVTKNEEGSPGLYTSVINLFLGTIFPVMESRGRFQFYILTLLRPYQRQALETHGHWPVPPEMTPYERYDLTIEAIIPKNERPQFDVYWGLMGETRWPCDLWVRRGSLKKEFVLPAMLKILSTT